MVRQQHTLNNVLFKIILIFCIRLYRETLDYMNFPAEYTDIVYNFPLEKADKYQQYVEDLGRKIMIGENNEPYKAKQTEKLEIAKLVAEIFSGKQIDW